MILRAIAIALFAACFTTAAAGVYKWTDSNGNIHYSDKPPATDTELLDIRSQRTDPERIAAQLQQRDQVREERATIVAADADRAEVERERAEQRSKNCERAQQALESLLSATRIYEPMPGGDRRYLDEDEIDERMAAARRDVDTWCNNNP